MNSRERVQITLNHKEPDRVPLDLGGSVISGMHVSSVYLLRQALRLDEPGTPVKVIEPYQMLGEIKPDLIDSLGVDVVSIIPLKNFFGFNNEGWKPWTTFDGTPVLVPEAFNTEPEPSGDILQYPEGDKSAPASGHMPKGGWYFDAIIRQPPLDEDDLNIEDNLEEFRPISEEELAYFGRKAKQLYQETDKAIMASFGGTSFGDIALVPATGMKHPKGIRDITEWYISTSVRRDYVYKIFEYQCDIALENLAKIYEVVGNRVTAVFVTGADFGAQNGPLISPKTYRELFKPFHIRVNSWIHKNTRWKTLIHSCGSNRAFYPDIIDAGFDILNPVQTSAAHMDPVGLKRDFGTKATFWGGGVDTQRVLPFGTPDEIRQDVSDRFRIFAPGGGFVFNTIHNVQPGVPIENLLALYETVNECRDYPIK